MSIVTDTFTEARQLGLLDGFVGTFADLRGQVAAAIEANAWDDEPDTDAAYERHLESSWAGADQYRWEEEQDRARNPFDRQTGWVFA